MLLEIVEEKEAKKAKLEAKVEEKRTREVHI